MMIYQQTISGDVLINRAGLDSLARDLMENIFKTEPTLRISLQQIKEHKFFVGKLDSADYWNDVCMKQVGEVPYKPNPLKY
jgi:hypothetical protein